MIGRPVFCTREQFLQVVRDTDTVPALYRDHTKLYGKTGLRAVKSCGLPDDKEVLMWPDGLCLLSPSFFALLEQACR